MLSDICLRGRLATCNVRLTTPFTERKTANTERGSEGSERRQSRGAEPTWTCRQGARERWKATMVQAWGDWLLNRETSRFLGVAGVLLAEDCRV